MFRGFHRIHLIGIGGIGMSGIAEVLLHLGAGIKVTGSDLRRSANTDRLESLGATVLEGHNAANVQGADVVVTSSAVRPDNPEVIAARQLQIPIIPRAEMLAELMRLFRYGVAVGGSHGKTTTTSMIATVMTHAGFDPTVVVGGKLASLGSNARLGHGDYVVVEADESDGSLVVLQPTITVLTNVDAEHLDHFRGGVEEICRCFTEFVNKVPFYGAVILCLDDANVQTLIPRVKRRTITYGFLAQADVTIRDLVADRDFGSEFTVYSRGVELGRMRLRVPGRHNVLNALAATAVGLDLQIEFEHIAAALGEFKGADRRFQVKGERAGVLVVDDYGHHPTEVLATLAAAATSGRRIVALFQPHRYTRTEHQMAEFSRAFYAADLVLVTDIYAASEDPIPGVTAEVLAQSIAAHGHKHAEYVGPLDAAVDRILELARPGDLVLTLGAGNVHRAGDDLLRRWEAQAG
jgi:UDP-N-acetylmuramate--alanine ligase